MQQVSGLGESVFLVKAGPTVTLTIPTAADFLVVLHGTFASSEATYQPGSFLDLSPMRRTGLTSGRRQGGLALMVGDDRLYRRVVHDWLAGLGRR